MELNLNTTLVCLRFNLTHIWVGAVHVGSLIKGPLLKRNEEFEGTLGNGRTSPLVQWHAALNCDR